MEIGVISNKKLPINVVLIVLYHRKKYCILICVNFLTKEDYKNK